MSTLDSNKLVEVSSVDGLTDASSKGYADTVNPSSIGQSGNFLGVSKANGVKWESRNLSVFPNFTLNSITYGNNLYVMCGDNGVVGTSTDTINWTLRTLGSTNYNSIAYYFENYYYVIAGTNQRISTDGISWSLGTSGFGSSAIRSIVYNNNGLYTAAGGGGTIRTSTNLISWTYRTSGFTTSISALIYNDGLYFAGGQNGRLSVSTDTITWELKTSGFGSSFISSIIYADGLYVAGGTGGTLATSTNGIFWSKIDTTNLSITDKIEDLTYGNGLYVYGAYYTANNLIVSSAIATSTDTVNWTFRTAQGIYTDSVRYLKYENNNFFAFPELEPKYVAVSSGDPVWSGNATENSIQTAPKGFVEYKVPGSYTFTVPPDANNFYIEAVGAGGGGNSSFRSSNGILSGGGGAGGAYYSTIVNRRDLNDANTIGVSVGKGGKGGGNQIYTSAGWISVSGSVNGGVNTQRKIQHVNDYFFNTYYSISSSADQNTSLFVSTDAIIWQLRTFDNFYYNSRSLLSFSASSYSYEDGIYVTGGAYSLSGHHIYSSTDTINWTIRTVPNVSNSFSSRMSSIVYSNGNFVAHVDNSFSNDGILTSTDSIVWQFRTLGSTLSVGKIYYLNEIYWAIVNGSTFLNSTDSIVWSSNTSNNFYYGPSSFNHNTLIYDGNYYIASVSDNDYDDDGRIKNLAISTDFTNWTYRDIGDPFNADIKSITYGDDIKGITNYLVFSGSDTESYLKSSTDLIVWSIRTANFIGYDPDAMVLYANKNYYCLVNPLSYYENDEFKNLLYASTDTVVWSLRTLGINKLVTVSNLSYLNDIFTLTGDYGTILASTDTVTWIARTSPFISKRTNVARPSTDFIYSNGLYSCATSGVDGRQLIYSSTDTISWTLNDSITVPDYQFSDYYNINGTYYLDLHGNGDFPSYRLISTDTITWIQSTASNPPNNKIYEEYFYCFKKIKDEFFVTASENFISSTTDFVSWKIRTCYLDYNDIDTFVYGNGIYLAGNQYDDIFSRSTDSIHWTSYRNRYIYYRNTADPQIIRFFDHLGLFVMGTRDAKLFTSSDALNWNLLSENVIYDEVNALYRNISYFNNQFYYLSTGVDRTIITSTDAINWKISTSYPYDYNSVNNYILYSVVYNNGIYTGVSAGSGSGRVIVNSTDFINWKTVYTRDFTINEYYTDLIYGNGTYVAYVTGGVPNIDVSTDGIVWSARTLPYSSGPAFFYNNNFFYCSPTVTDPKLLISTDAINWTIRTTGFGSTSLRSVLYQSGLYYVSGDVGSLAVSTDSISWVRRTSGFGFSAINTLTYGNGIYIAAGYGGTLTTSTDGISWIYRTALPSSFLGYDIILDVKYLNNLYIAASNGSYIGTSTDSIVWTQYFIPMKDYSPEAIMDIEYGNGRYVVSTEEALISSSTDFINWTQSTLPNVNGFNYYSYVSYLNNLYIYTNDNDNVCFSTDSIVWTYVPFNIDNTIGGNVTYFNGKYVIISDTANYATSTDVIVWEYRTSTFPIPNNDFQLDRNNPVISDGKIRILCNTMYSNVPSQILSSTDLINWDNTSILTKGYYSRGVKVYESVDGTFIGNNRQFGNLDEILVSDDLVNWTMRTTPIGVSTSILNKGTYSLSDLTYGNGIYVASFSKYRLTYSINALVSSTDTINWTIRTNPMNFAYSGTKLVYGNGYFMSIAAGDSFTDGNYNLLTYSTDAIVWQKFSDLSLYDYRGFPPSITYGNSTFAVCNPYNLYVLGKFPLAGQYGFPGTLSSITIGSNNFSAGGGSIDANYINGVGHPGGNVSGGFALSSISGMSAAAGKSSATQVVNTITQTTSRQSVSGGSGAVGTPAGISGDNTLSYYYGNSYLLSGGSSSSNWNGDSAVDTGVYSGSRGGAGGGAIRSVPYYWELRTSGFGSSAIFDYTYANNLHTLVGEGGTLTISTDGIAWVYRTTGITGAPRLYNILYANNLYVAGGGNVTVDTPFLVTSTDTFTWELRTTGFPSTSAFYETLYVSGLYYATGKGVISVSTDAINWTFRTSGFGTSLIEKIIYANNLFVASGQGRSISVSTDGVTWVYRTSGGVSSITSLSYNNNLYLASGDGGIVLVSTDTISWRRRTTGFGTTSIFEIGYYNNLYYAAGATGRYISSTDTITWIREDVPVSSATSILVSNVIDGLLSVVFAGMGGNVFYGSALLSTWSQRTSGFGATSISALTYGNGVYLAGANGASLSSSTDTINWRFRTSGFGTTSIFTLTYGNGLYVAAGVRTLATSTDTINWTLRTSSLLESITFLNYYNNSFYVAVTNQANINVSTDAINWTYRTSGKGTFASFSASAYGNGLYLAGGYDVILTSTDTITWISRTSGYGSTNILALTYGSGVYVAGGRGATLTTSTDTITWILRTTGLEGTNITSLLYSDGLFVAGSQTANGLFVVSTDAINWEYRVSGFGTSYIGALTYGNNLYVAAGDGITASFSYGYKFAAGKGGDGLYGGGGGGGGFSTEPNSKSIITEGGDGGDGYVRITWW